MTYNQKKGAAPEDAAQFREETPQKGQALYMLHRNTMKGGPERILKMTPLIKL
jgi:hypothetical protein